MTDWVTAALVGVTVDSVIVRLCPSRRRWAITGAPLRDSFQQVKILVQRWVPRRLGLRWPLRIWARPAEPASVTVGNVIGGDLRGDPRLIINICHELMDSIDVCHDLVVRGGWRGPGSHALIV